MIRFKSRLLICAAACAGLLGLLPALAHGDNIARNPGFETESPLRWSGASGATVVRDADANPPFAHSGTAHLNVTVAGSFGAAQMDCVPAVPGVYTLSYWFLTSDPDVTQVNLIASFYPTTDCTGGSTNLMAPYPLSTTSPDRDGAWHQATVPPPPPPPPGPPPPPPPPPPPAAPAGTQSAQLYLVVSCSCTGTGATGVANFDDVVVDNPAALAVAFRGLSATRARQGALLRWRTASEFALLGFRVYREVAGKRVRVSRLIAAWGGGSYSFLDRRAPNRVTVRYWIEAVNLDGSRRWHGPARLR